MVQVCLLTTILVHVAEVLVDGNKAHLIRRRENLSELWALESIAK